MKKFGLSAGVPFFGIKNHDEKVFHPINFPPNGIVRHVNFELTPLTPDLKRLCEYYSEPPSGMKLSENFCHMQT